MNIERPASRHLDIRHVCGNVTGSGVNALLSQVDVIADHGVLGTHDQRGVAQVDRGRRREIRLTEVNEVAADVLVAVKEYRRPVGVNCTRDSTDVCLRELHGTNVDPCSVYTGKTDRKIMTDHDAQVSVRQIDVVAGGHLLLGQLYVASGDSVTGRNLNLGSVRKDSAAGAQVRLLERHITATAEDVNAGPGRECDKRARDIDVTVVCRNVALEDTRLQAGTTGTQGQTAVCGHHHLGP